MKREKQKPAPQKKRKETREAISWFEESRKQQKKILKRSTSTPKKRGYVTTNYALAKGKKGKYITPEEYKNQQKVLKALEKTSQYLAVETNITVILEKIAKTVTTALGAKQLTVWDFTPDKKGAFIIAAYGMQKQYIEHSRKDPLPIGGAWLGRAMATGQAWATSDIWKDPVLPKSWLRAVKKQNYHGLLCIPLMRKNEIIGGMCLYHKDPHEFQFFEINIMTIVANQAATAIENARIFGDLQTERTKTISIIYSLNDGLIMYDPEGRILFFNPRAQELLLVGLKDVIGKKIDEVSAKGSIYLENLQRVSRLVQKDYAVKEYATEGPQKLILEVTQIPVRDRKNKKIGTMHILHDITREKEVEQLQASFVTIASHQLRTPLSGIKWSLDSFLKGELGPLNQNQKGLLAKIFDTNEHLIDLVNDLLDVSRIEEGRFGYTFILSDITKTVDKIVQNLEINAKSRNINLTFEKPSGPLPKVSVDTSKLELSIQNVIDNGVKYTDTGGFVKIKLRTEKKSLLLIVEDNGIGIPKKDQGFIFHKFFRAENAIRYQTEGSGLGLFIARSIVEKHNGLIHFESEEAKGSAFIIQLPLDPEKMPKGKIEGL